MIRMSIQRFRVWFAKGDRVRFISHLDVLRYWERAIRRAGLPLAYSQGFTPHPKIAFAGPLPLGFTSEAEVMDVTLDGAIDARTFAEKILVEATGDFAISRVEEIAAITPSPQALVLWADYRVDVPGINTESGMNAVTAFVAAREFPWTEERRESLRSYDLRASVASLSAEPCDGGVRLHMRVQTDQERTIRPEHVVMALFGDLPPGPITRTGLVLDTPSPARDAWRRRGQYE